MMKRHNFTSFAGLAALAAALALPATVLAQAATPSEAAPAVSVSPAEHTAAPKYRGAHFHKHSKRGHGHFKHDAALRVPGYGSLDTKTVESLKLTETQKTLLQKTQEAQKAERSAHREAMKTWRTDRLKALQAGKIDPAAALKAQQDARVSMAKLQDQQAEKWLAVWNALDAEQQQIVVGHFAEQSQKRAQHRQKRADEMQKRAAEMAS